MKLRPIVKIHGGKRYLADWIIQNFPCGYTDMTYVEPYCGAASVLLNKPRSRVEMLNDVDPGMVAILEITRDRAKEFAKKLSKIPYREDTFEEAQCKEGWNQDEMQYAINEFILRRMSRGGLKSAFAWSDRQRGGQPGDVNAWQSIIKMVPQISERLQGVEIYNETALEFLWLVNQENTLAYCDPPYLPKTRQAKKAYRYEMTEKAHKKLAWALNSFRGKVLLSGNPAPLYDKIYAGWESSRRTIANHSSQQKVKQYRTEVLWRGPLRR